MPIKYDCQNCNLTFMVGGYHGHNFYGEYTGGSCLVCWGCGLSYHLSHANKDRGPEYFYEYAVEIVSYKPEAKMQLMKYIRKAFDCELGEVKRLLANLPIIDNSLMYEYIDEQIKQFNDQGIIARKVVVDREPNPDFGLPLAQDKLHTSGHLTFVGSENDDIEQLIELSVKRTVQTGKIDFSQFECINCHQKGLVDAGYDKDIKQCPNCKEKTLVENGGFVT